MRALSGMDASFLYFETPTMHMQVVGVLLLDVSETPGWGRDRLVELLRERLELLPPFRRKLHPAAFRLHHPVWTDVDDVDLEEHVDTVTCPAPGTPAELHEIVADFAAEKLDRSKPLFRIRVVEGLADGRVAVIIKVHHSAVDGVAAAHILTNLVDLDPAGRTPEQLAEARTLTAIGDAEAPSLPELVAHTAKGVLGWPLGLARLIPATGRSVARLVSSRGSDDGGGTSGGAVPFTAPRAPFNGRIGPRRAVALVDVPMDDIKAVKNAAGGTFNDAVMSVCGGALRRYLEAHGDVPSNSLIAVVPVSVRGNDEPDNGSANRTSAMFTSLATHIPDPLRRMQAVHRSNDAGKAVHAAFGDRILAQAAQLAPPNLTSIAARLYSASGLAERHPVVHNLVVSNVAGPPFQVYLAGARVEGLFPLGPVLEGSGLNITVISYRDRVGFGLIACRDRLPDLEQLAAAVPEALRELVEATASC